MTYERDVSHLRLHYRLGAWMLREIEKRKREAVCKRALTHGGSTATAPATAPAPAWSTAKSPNGNLDDAGSTNTGKRHITRARELFP